MEQAITIAQEHAHAGHLARPLEHVVLFDPHHRQLAPLGAQRIALAVPLLLLHEKLLARAQPRLARGYFRHLHVSLSLFLSMSLSLSLSMSPGAARRGGARPTPSVPDRARPARVDLAKVQHGGRSSGARCGCVIRARLLARSETTLPRRRRPRRLARRAHRPARDVRR